MQKKQLLKLIIISLFAFHVTALPIVYAVFPPEYETFVSKKSITVKPEELTILNFYMPPGKADMIKFEFNISDGRIRYYHAVSSRYETNTANLLQFLEKNDLTIDTFFQETDSGTRGIGWSGADCRDGKSTPIDVDHYYVDQKWDIFLYNEDAYDKEVVIDISKKWQPW